MINLQLNITIDLIYPTGFYRKKAVILCIINQKFIQNFNGYISHTKEKFLSFLKIGHKISNLILNQEFNISVICVNTNVHRITHRMKFM